jgi:hypothetical protein
MDAVGERKATRIEATVELLAELEPGLRRALAGDRALRRRRGVIAQNRFTT